MKLSDFKPKRPQLRRRKGSGGAGPSVKAPKFATDLYADLRDRRLLPLVALLLVAIAAAPFLLGGGEDEEVPATIPPAAGGAVAAAQASFAVVPEKAILRDYRTRLGHREARNPFEQPLAPAQSEAGGEPESTTGGAAGEPAVPVEGEVETGEEGSAQPKTTTNIVVQNKVLGYEIEARTGYVGFVKRRPGIAPTAKLPSPKKPVVVFAGFSKDKKGALFLMSSNVTAYYGKARCVVDKQACQLVELRPGKSATFAYGYGESRYKISLRRIVPVIDTHAVEATVTKKRGRNRGAGRANTTSGRANGGLSATR
jgi:hypothetical protein